MDPNDQLTFGNIFKNSVLEGFSLQTQSLDAPTIMLTLGIALALGVLVFYIYKMTYKGVLYSLSFNVSLILLTLVTSFVILTISHSFALSLGMVGALSIVRFRTAVKEPLDTTYMFWAIATGISVGAGFYLYSIIATLTIGVIMFLLSLVPGLRSQHFLLVMHYSEDAQLAVNQLVARFARGSKLKSKTVTPGGVEMTLEIKLPNAKANIVNELMAIRGVQDATLVSYQTDML